MKTYTAHIDINATPEAVWNIITDGSRYTEWDLGMTRLDGIIALGQPLTIYAKIAPNRAFKVKVSVFEPPRRMVWRSGMPLGLFKGERTFELELQSNGVMFTLSEVFSGPMLALIGGAIPDMTPVFEAFCAALKQRAEGA